LSHFFLKIRGINPHERLLTNESRKWVQLHYASRLVIFRLGAKVVFLFGGIAPRDKLTTAACMHHELLLLFQEARGTNYNEQGYYYSITEEIWKQFSKGAAESMSTAETNAL
jgi:SUMO ligase MMS21 Smc5/6 complex component